MVCSGGTSSRCTAHNHWTLDLRKKYQQINFDLINKTVEVGGGISMASLLNELKKYERSFPTGLSGLPGIGYILTGGISPLSRSQGLAIDQVLEIKGVWGNGYPFKITKPTNLSNSKDELTWKGLCGAAPFLGIVTNLTLKTQILTPLEIWQSLITKEQLIEAIQQAEEWPNSMSLQWIWGDIIKVYIVIKNDVKETNQDLRKFKKEFPSYQSLQVSKVLGLHDIPRFRLYASEKKSTYKFHSEVLGLLGPEWGENSIELIKTLEELMSNRPNPYCYIASQQLGGFSSQISKSKTSFIHRNAIWKPWITASWQAGNQEERARSLKWLEEGWQTLSSCCPGVHAAQMHQHLPWHLKGIKSAFEDWLPGLKDLKSQYDPQGILPQL